MSRNTKAKAKSQNETSINSGSSKITPINATHAQSSLCLSSQDYFREVVDEAFEDRKIKTVPLARTYLINLLNFYMVSENLFDEPTENGRKSKGTLAETYLRAANSEPRVRNELLKQLGDKALYISGFFADSLNRKIVDVDYYVDMGGSAYSTLADSVKEESLAELYREYATKFTVFADVLTFISNKSAAQNEANIMRLYENYAKTGSSYARDLLMERGLIAVPRDTLTKKAQ